jgi:hypothetical protein
LTFYISIERDRIESEKHKSSRYRARIRTEPAGHALFVAGSVHGSVSEAKAVLEDEFGVIGWSAGHVLIRGQTALAVAEIKLERV